MFIDSFDCKECYSADFIQQKLEYIHRNPLSKHWHLTDTPESYLHSSAKFYLSGEQGIYPVKH